MLNTIKELDNTGPLPRPICTYCLNDPLLMPAEKILEAVKLFIPDADLKRLNI